MQAGLAPNCTHHRSIANLTGKTTSIPTCPRPTRFPSSTCPSAGTAACGHRAGRGEKTIRIHEHPHGGGRGQAGPRPVERPDPGRTTTAAACPSSRSSPSRTSAPPRRSSPTWKSCEPTLQYLGVSDCKMQEGSLRVRREPVRAPRRGSEKLGTRTEMKNMNSFKAIARAIAYEAAAADRAAGRREAGGPGDPPLGRRTRTPPTPCAPRRTPRTTAISPSRTCRRWSCARSIWSSVRAALPELAEEKHGPLSGGRAACRELRRGADHRPKGPGRLVRGAGGPGADAQAGGQLDHGRRCWGRCPPAAMEAKRYAAHPRHPGPAHGAGDGAASSTATPPSKCSRPSSPTTATWTPT